MSAVTDQAQPLRIVGTNHVSSDSTQRVLAGFAEHNPDVVAVELDDNRLRQLRHGERQAPSLSIAKHIGFTGYVFARVAYFVQQRISKHIGIMPGAEMLNAAELAGKHGRPLHLIDQPIQITLQNLSQRLGFREKARLAWDVISSPFRKPPFAFKPGEVPGKDLIRDIRAFMEERYPTLFQTILDDRDRYMAKRIHDLLQQGNTVLAVVGAAHKPGVESYLARYEAQ